MAGRRRKPVSGASAPETDSSFGAFLRKNQLSYFLLFLSLQKICFARSPPVPRRHWREQKPRAGEGAWFFRHMSEFVLICRFN